MHAPRPSCLPACAAARRPSEKEADRRLSPQGFMGLEGSRPPPALQGLMGYAAFRRREPRDEKEAARRLRHRESRDS